ncbi:MAG: deoxyribodipyrimidine photo-lyase [Pseudomonadota bacterium]|nr:deoxyribodipyrimidine photo-lyase [Pseudomonadota bacterium]
MQVVWFKRDLRVQDHRALAYAAQRGQVLPLYVVEPDYWRLEDVSCRHWDFAAETLVSLRDSLAALGQPLLTRVGAVVDVLERLRRTVGVDGLWSHEETGNGWTYARDKQVGAWCRAHGVPWKEIPQHGVQRRMASRNGWAAQWDRFMAEPIVNAPVLKPTGIEAGPIPSARDLNLVPDGGRDRQAGGRAAAEGVLSSFLAERGRTYRRAMSSPLSGARACSRLSPHLAWGSLSMREVTQATWARQREVKALGARDGWSGDDGSG